MKFIDENVWKYLSVKLPMLGAFLLLVIIPGLQWAVDFKVIPTEYHATITGVVIVWLGWIGRKIYQPSLHSDSASLGFVAITAGHSNKDPGAVAHGLLEAELCTKFRNAVAQYLRDSGLIVKTDGVWMTNEPLANAIKLVSGSSTAIEFHMNAAVSAQANGIETISLPKDKALAQNLSKAVADVFGSRLRGQNGWIDQSQSARGKLGFVNAGGLIVELGFITNKAELDQFNAKYWLAAKAVAKVIADHEKSN